MKAELPIAASAAVSEGADDAMLGSEATGESPLSNQQRKRVLSALRLKLTLTVFVVAIVLGLSAMLFMGVSRIFDWLTPSIQRDLQHKVQRAALEVAQTAQTGIVVKDTALIASAVADYVRDADVLAVVIEDTSGQELFRYGSSIARVAALLRLPAGVAHDLGAAYGAWAGSEIEGQRLGRVAMLLSKARLEAGMQLRRDVLVSAGIGSLVALGLCLLFVNMYIGPILRVTEEAFLGLERTTEAALAASRMKSHFLANMSHEIRTPMNGIIGMLDLLSRTTLTVRQQRFTQTIESSSRGLLTIVDDILDFSKLEAGKYIVRRDDFELRQMVQEVAELLSPKAHAKGIELVLNVEPSLPYSIHADVDRVKQVLQNLIGNAIKFTDRGHILVRVAKAAPSAEGFVLRVAVEDTGIGIHERDQASLFGVFSQVDGSLTRKQGGTGLGLAICKRLVEAMGGAIGVNSEPGRGSTFWFTLPTRAGELADLEEELPRRDARVLLVSDSEAQRQTLSELVEHWGMRCTVADDAQQAERFIVGRDSHRFDAIVVDGSFEPRHPASVALSALCTSQALPILLMLSTTQMASGTHEGAQKRLLLTKPVRVSELYNGLISLLDGVDIAQNRKEPGSSAHPDHPDVSRGKVLVVDDNEVNREVAVELLGELGYDSETAENGAQAVAKAAQGGHLAILMDCQMPEMDGYEATRRIRALPAPLCKLPIIALTAHAMSGDRDRVLEAGMDDYTTKPVRARVLSRILQRWTTAATLREQAPAGDELAPAIDVSAGTSPELDPTLPRSPRVVELFLRAMPDMLAALSSAIEAGDAPRARALAHKLKGSCLGIGAEQMADACHSVELAAAQGAFDRQTLQRLPALFASLERLLAPRGQDRRPAELERRG